MTPLIAAAPATSASCSAQVSACRATRDTEVSTCREQLRAAKAATNTKVFTPAELAKFGQVRMDTAFGKELYKMASRADVKLVLELGTWKGAGSSTCIAKGLRDTSGFLITVEAFQENYLIAQKSLAEYPAKVLYGTTVHWSQHASEEEVEESQTLANHKREQWTGWLKGEIDTAKYHEVPMLQPLCKTHKFDFIFMDGKSCSA
jgi:predicted O-methyltransferase YrrM